MSEPLKVKTPRFRVSYPHVFKPRLNTLSGKQEFSVDALFPKKGSDLTVLKEAQKKAIAEMWPDGAPKNLRGFITDGDEKGGECAGHWVMKMKSYLESAPIIVGPKKINGKLPIITNPKEFYGGCFARAVVTIKAYDKNGGRGVSAWLDSLQKLEDGEKFGAPPTDPDADFSDSDDATEADQQADDWG